VSASPRSIIHLFEVVIFDCSGLISNQLVSLGDIIAFAVFLAGSSLTS
jgi:hypothetical protein